MNYSQIIATSQRLLDELAITPVNAKLVSELMMEIKRDVMGIKDLDCSFLALKAALISWKARIIFWQKYNFRHLAFKGFEVAETRLKPLIESKYLKEKQKADLREIYSQIPRISVRLVEHPNRFIDNRLDCLCCLCREAIASETGSHMVPNFIAHKSFSFDKQGKRFREALNFMGANDTELFSSYYGNQVPTERIETAIGHELEEDFSFKNINILEYDNEFCSGCEKRFSILETVYAIKYNNPSKNLSPRISYLFWLSVLWRMDIGRLGLFMDFNDEMNLRQIVDSGIEADAKTIAKSESDLGNWKYAAFICHDLHEGDWACMGSREEHSPYWIIANDMILAFFPNIPSSEELRDLPLTIDSANLNDWKHPEDVVEISRSDFWKIRDMLEQQNIDHFDPPLEHALTNIREMERTSGHVLDSKAKDKAIMASRLSMQGPFIRKPYPWKGERFLAASIRIKKAKETGETYDPLNDAELFLTQQDFDKYYMDLAYFSRLGLEMKGLPFYSEALAAIPDEFSKAISDDDIRVQCEYEKSLGDFLEWNLFDEAGD